tara:strand:- start:1154 stop:1762 length:609 start_codon:yes stop_codon:yes gene_type:complete
MKFATVDGRTSWVDIPVRNLAAFRGDVCDVLDVCPTYIFTNMGRIVTDVVDVCGEVVVLADSNVSLLAQEVCSAVNRGGGRPLIAVEDTGALSLNQVFLHGLRPVLANRRMVLVLCLASPITDARPVLNMSVHGTSLLQGCPDADPKFGEAIERVLTSFDARSALPCVLTTLVPVHTGIFVQPLPWRTGNVCSCCGAATFKL